MKIFHLPDLGEGLAEAEIREWYVKEGDVVRVDQPLVSLETAKAVVDVPSPYAGKILKLHGAVNQIIETGAPLVDFEGEGAPAKPKAAGSVVGALEESDKQWNEGDVVIGAAKTASKTAKILPAVRALAKQLHVDINQVIPTGPQGLVTAEDVKRHANQYQANDMEELHGVRRTMASIMTQSHQEVAAATIIDDADISELVNVDMTVRVLQAMVAAAKAEPALNAWFNGKLVARQLHQEVNIGLAVDTAEGLFVPVLKNVASHSDKSLRELINKFKTAVTERTISPSDMQGATIILSNFGTLAGKYATPVIVPPMVAILGCGRAREVAGVTGEKIIARRILPLSLTFDHRAVTGGEASRYLGAVIKELESG